MKLQLFKTLWGHTTGLDEAIRECHAHGFAGIEGPLPVAPRGRAVFRQRLANEGLSYIAEICTAGGYVPDHRATPGEHLESFRKQAEAAVDCSPLFITSIAGCDVWSRSESIDFFGAALEIAEALGVGVGFETHRSRSLFNPWITREILEALPQIRITCDFSHWCCVCERLVMDFEPQLLTLCAERARHIHARVGYAQGPQVPHPAAAEHREALEAHERWWSAIWRGQRAHGIGVSTMTPEFGPDGYLQCAPFTQTPVADVVEINSWMAARERDRFVEWHAEPHKFSGADEK